MSLFDEPENPRWKLLAVAEERLETAPSRDAVITVARAVPSADGVIFAIKTLSRAVGRALADYL